MGVIVSAVATTTANWIPDINRYGLPKPPTWFLQQMWDMDAALVLLPSRSKQKYLVARRRDRSARVPMIVKAVKQLAEQTRFSDADLLGSHSLIHVDAIQGYAHGSWSPFLLQALKDRDMWAVGGADAYIDYLEAQENAAEEKQRATLLSNIDHRARDAWRSYQARTGQRSGAMPSRQSRAKIVQVGTL